MLGVEWDPEVEGREWEEREEERGEGGGTIAAHRRGLKELPAVAEDRREAAQAPRARRQVVFSDFFFFRFYLLFRAPCSWPQVRRGSSGLE
jgi:hypothetical protein